MPATTLNKIAEIYAAEPGPVFRPRTSRGDAVGLLHIEVNGGAEVQLQGRLDPSMPWTDLLEATATTNQIVAVVLPPEIRVNVTVHTSGYVQAYLLE